MSIDEYHIEEEPHGRGGWVFYVGQTRLPFAWEMMAVDEDAIRIPTLEEWDDFCKKHNANWAKNSREKILRRVGEGYLKKNYRRGTFKIEDKWIVIKPPPSFISRILEFFH